MSAFCDVPPHKAFFYPMSTLSLLFVTFIYESKIALLCVEQNHEVCAAEVEAGGGFRGAKHGLTKPANTTLYRGWREFKFNTASLPPACHNHGVQIMLTVMELPSLGYEWEFRNRVVVPVTTSPLNSSPLLPRFSASLLIGINWFSAVTKTLIMIRRVIAKLGFSVFCFVLKS